MRSGLVSADVDGFRQARNSSVGGRKLSAGVSQDGWTLAITPSALREGQALRDRRPRLGDEMFPDWESTAILNIAVILHILLLLHCSPSLCSRISKPLHRIRLPEDLKNYTGEPSNVRAYVVTQFLLSCS